MAGQSVRALVVCGPTLETRGLLGGRTDGRNDSSVQEGGTLFFNFAPTNPRISAIVGGLRMVPPPPPKQPKLVVLGKCDGLTDI